MRSRLLLNLFLLVLVTGLAIYLFSRPEEMDVEQPPLTKLQADTIDNITLLRQGLEEIRFVRHETGWVMTAPYKLPANSARIRRLLQLTAEPSLGQIQIEQADLSRFRLDQPQASIVFNTTRIDYGDTHPLNDQRYVKVNDAVHLVNDTLFQQLRVAPTFYLDHRLLPADKELTAIHLPELIIERSNGEWTVKTEQNIENLEPEKLVQAWRDASAITVQRYEPAEAYAAVTFRFDGDEVLAYELVGDPDKPVLARPDIGIQYHLSGFDKEHLFPKNGEPEPVANDAPISAPVTNH